MSPLKLITLFLATGIFITSKTQLVHQTQQASQLQISSSVIPFVGVSGFLCLFIFLYSFFASRSRFISLSALRQSCILYLAALLCGGYIYLERNDRSRLHISSAAPYNTPVTVAGEVLNSTTKDSYTDVVLNAQKVYADTLSLRTKGRLLLRLPEPVRKLTDGTYLIVTGRMIRIKGKRNPGDFDYQSFLARTYVYSRFDTSQWTTLAIDPPLSSIARRYLFEVRSAIKEGIGTATQTEHTHALLQALILGEQSLISSATLEQFRNAGLSHVLAVSGLHVLCVGLMLYSLLKPLCLRIGFTWRAMETTRVCLTLLVLCSYLCLAQFKPAVLRATVMTTLFIVAPLFQRPAASIDTMYVAALVLLIIDPNYLFQPGFQLSFGAVASILHMYPKLPAPTMPDHVLGRLGRFALSSMNVSLAAMIGTLPITLFHFNLASSGGLLLNLAAIPLTTGLLTSGILLLLSLPLHADLASLFGQSAELFAQLLLVIAERGAAVFPAFVLPHGGQLAVLFSVSGVLLFLIFSFKISVRWGTVCCLSSGLLVMQWTPIVRSAYHPQLHAVFFDVGHGDAAWITFPNGRRLLVDTGNTPGSPDSHVILNHMRRYRIGCIDAVVLTHPDQDHTGGLASIVEHACVRAIYTSGDRRFELPDSASIETEVVTAGDTIILDSSVTIRVLAPPPSLVDKENRNDGSLVLSIEYGSTRFLFMGDAEEAAERFLTTHYSPFLPSEVIKVGHHGSSTSSAPSLVRQAARPGTFALISTGPPSQYGLPDEDVVLRWQKHKATLHTTAASGALWLTSDGTRVRSIPW